MSKIDELNKSIQAIDSNDYNRAIGLLGPTKGTPEYEAKREILSKQIVNSKVEVDRVAASLTVLDKKLSDAQSSINPFLSKLEEGLTTNVSGYNDLVSDMKKVQKRLSLIRFNIATMNNKLVNLGNKIGR